LVKTRISPAFNALVKTITVEFLRDIIYDFTTILIRVTLSRRRCGDAIHNAE